MTPIFAIFSLWQAERAAAGSRQHRTARLPLPRAIVSDPKFAEKPALASVSEFVDSLVEVPLETWLAIGRNLVADRNGLAVRQAGWGKVETAVREGDLGLAAWSVRDALDTVAFLASRHASRWSREERCAFAATQGAAEAAALALLVRARIRDETVRALCAPFADSIELHVS